MKLIRVILFIVMFLPLGLYAQSSKDIVVDYNNPKKYIIGDIKVSGAKFISPEQIISFTGLEKGMEITIPSEAVSEVVKRVYAQRFFSHIEFVIDSLSPKKDTCFLELKLKERPRVSRWSFSGVRKSEQTDLMERVKLRRGGELSDYVIKSSTDIIKKYFKEKGFLKADVTVSQEVDSLVKNAVKVTFNITKGPKVKIETITFTGNTNIKSSKLESAMKKTKGKGLKNILKSKKFKVKDLGGAEVEEAKVIPKSKVVREKVYNLTPMTVEDAIEEMELLGHDFYVFLNKSTGNTCVLYVRNDKDYGLIETTI